ncbi:lipoteichoic acid synthase 2 [Clostridium acetireducens DSM 10703]|jgi:lipoteichoic acid synthase|uniref:Lipoteichoic acid synthase 2 n=1 Tax=Clostridium acetireducens DSM 10703 TaxID=1121290 RepID=A0A1E8EZ50_9CLOT|nr:LTA synthase family protein [Clostridium acetireducens]OFI06300.1 lipoteichoic acid synthase 2 [Clostridium acetireducens DSM 10703]
MKKLLKTLSNYKDFFIDYLDIIFFILAVTIKALFFGKQISPIYFSVLSILPAIISSLMVLVSISFLFSRRKRTKILYILNLIITICMIADINYFRYFKDVISIPVVKTGFQLNDVGSSVGSIFKFQDLLYAVDLVFIIPVIKVIQNRANLQYKNLTLKFKFAVFAVMISAGLLVNGTCMVQLSKEQPRLLKTMYNRVYVARSLGAVNYHILDVYNYINFDISKRTPLPAEKENNIKKFLNNNTSSDTQKYKGIAKDKNLIVMQVEALQEFVINQKVNGQEITPNLNKLASKSMYFNNYFYQIAAGGTSDAEFMSNNSLYPAASGVAYYMYCDNEFNSLSQSLKKKGYTTAAFHGYRESFWNRNVMYKKMEFDEFFGESSFNVDETIGLGLSDKSFFEQSIPKLKKLKEPYYAFMITLTSHFPFDGKDYGDFNVGEYEGTLLGDYFKSIHYTDAQIGMFLDELEKEGMLENTIIALYGDHLAIPKQYEASLAKFLNNEAETFTELQWSQLQKVPMMLHFPGDKYKCVNPLYSAEMDLYPTLSNLFDLNSKNLMGKDLLNSKNGNVIFRDGSFTDGNVFYMCSTGNYYDINTGEKISETPELADKKQEALNQLSYSDEILKHNLLKKFNEENNK